MCGKEMFVNLVYVLTLTVGKENPGMCRNLIFPDGKVNTQVVGKWYPSYFGVSVDLVHCKPFDILEIPNGGLTLTEHMKPTVEIKPSREQAGKYTLTFPNQDAPYAYYNFIDSDVNTNYVVLVVCVNLGDTHDEQVWVMSRQPELADNFLKKAKVALVNADINEELRKNKFC